MTETPGLFLLGLTWQHTRGSALLGWVKDDAEFLAGRIAADAKDRLGADAAAAAHEKPRSEPIPQGA
jgi:putative flavoprotein involved in K+ transport